MGPKQGTTRFRLNFGHCATLTPFLFSLFSLCAHFQLVPPPRSREPPLMLDTFAPRGELQINKH